MRNKIERIIKDNALPIAGAAICAASIAINGVPSSVSEFEQGLKNRVEEAIAEISKTSVPKTPPGGK